MANQLKLTNLWENYLQFIEKINASKLFTKSFPTVTKEFRNFPKSVRETGNPSDWAGFADLVIESVAGAQEFADFFDGYTEEELMGVVWACRNKPEAIKAKMLEALAGQEFGGLEFGASEPAAGPLSRAQANTLTGAQENARLGEALQSAVAMLEGKGLGDSPVTKRAREAIAMGNAYAQKIAIEETAKLLPKRPATASSVKRKSGLGTVGRYVREFRDDDQDVIVIGGVQWQLSWMKQKVEDLDFRGLCNYAIKLKNLLTGEIMVFPNAAIIEVHGDQGYSGAFGHTKYSANFLGYGTGRGGYDRPQPPYMTQELKDYFARKLHGGKLEYDSYPKGTTNDRIRARSGIEA